MNPDAEPAEPADAPPHGPWDESSELPMASGDAERLQDVVHVLHGPGGAGVMRATLYASYVSALLAATYGFTVARAIFAASDPLWLRRTLLTVPGAVGAGLFLLGTAAVAFRAGRVRGPVVPPLPWTEHVVSTAIDRWLVLRPWWLVSASLTVVGGLIVGGVVGAGLWAGGAASAGALVVGLASGGLCGVIVVLAWLRGQSGASTWSQERATVLPRRALRATGIAVLREQGVRSAHLGGAVLAGDLRAARLEVATGVRRARRVRLQPGSPILTVARRDLLGLRRQPGMALAGLALTVPAAAVLGWALVERRVPPGFVIVAAVVTHLGVGQWGEGLRLSADSSGCPPLFGLRPRAEAIAHTLTPGILTVLVLTVTGVATAAAVAGFGGGVHGPGMAALALPAAGWLLSCALALTILQWLVAYRGQPPRSAFLPESGPATLLLWQARPLLLAALIVGGLTAYAGHVGVTAAAPLLLLALLALGAWAVRQQRLATQAHRT